MDKLNHKTSFARWKFVHTYTQTQRHTRGIIKQGFNEQHTYIRMNILLKKKKMEKLVEFALVLRNTECDIYIFFSCGNSCHSHWSVILFYTLFYFYFYFIIFSPLEFVAFTFQLNIIQFFFAECSNGRIENRSLLSFELENPPEIFSYLKTTKHLIIVESNSFDRFTWNLFKNHLKEI